MFFCRFCGLVEAFRISQSKESFVFDFRPWGVGKVFRGAGGCLGVLEGFNCP